MDRKWTSGLVILVMGVACLMGCGPADVGAPEIPGVSEEAGPPPAPPEQPAQGSGTPMAPAMPDMAEPVFGAEESEEELIAQWNAIADQAAGGSEIDPFPAQAIAEKLMGKGGPIALDPLLDRLADPSSDPRARVLVVQSLERVVHSSMLRRLKNMVAPDQDPTTRACAVHLIGLIKREDLAAETLLALVDDPEPRVRFAAMLGLARQDDAGIRAKLAEMYVKPETSAQEKQEIAVALANNPTDAELLLLARAAIDPELGANTRIIASGTVAQRGGRAEAEVLKQRPEPQDEMGAQINAFIDQAIQTIELRESAPEERAAPEE